MAKRKRKSNGYEAKFPREDIEIFGLFFGRNVSFDFPTASCKTAKEVSN